MDKRAALDKVIADAEELRMAPHALYKRARVSSATWHRIVKDPEKMEMRTLEKLEKAIAAKRAEG